MGIDDIGLDGDEFDVSASQKPSSEKEKKQSIVDADDEIAGIFGDMDPVKEEEKPSGLDALPHHGGDSAVVPLGDGCALSWPVLVTTLTHY